MMLTWINKAGRDEGVRDGCLVLNPLRWLFSRFASLKDYLPESFDDVWVQAWHEGQEDLFVAILVHLPLSSLQLQQRRVQYNGTMVQTTGMTGARITETNNERTNHARDSDEATRDKSNAPLSVRRNAVMNCFGLYFKRYLASPTGQCEVLN